MSRAPEAPSFAAELYRLRVQNGLSLREIAGLVHHGKTYVHELETGQKPPTAELARRFDRALGAGGRLAGTLRPAMPDGSDSEIEALERAQRISASDVSHETLDRLECAADTMAMAYATTPPDQLLPRVRRHLDYVAALVDARKTLSQHRRLLIVGGWFPLLRATLHIDLQQAPAADAYLTTAGQLAEQAEHPGDRRVVPGNEGMGRADPRRLPAGPAAVPARTGRCTAGRIGVHPDDRAGRPGMGQAR